MKLFPLLKKLRGDTEGATMIEYALIAGLISVVAIVALTSVGTGVTGKMNSVATELNK